jgi:nucleoside-diphosphate-sugar epimerase
MSRPGGKVLVTGGNGFVAGAAIPALRDDGWHVRGLDLEPVAIADESLVGNIADAGVMDRAVEGMDVVIHLAAYPDPADLFEVLFEPNVVGLCRVLEAVRRAAVPRLVMASSIQVVSRLKHLAPLGPQHAMPCNNYAMTKRWAEVAGEMYARLHGTAVIMARLGWLPRTAFSFDKVRRMGSEDIYLSHDDCARFFLNAVNAPMPPHAFHIVYGVSKAPGPPRVDLASTHAAIGYTPQHTYPQGAAPSLASRHDPDHPDPSPARPADAIS